MPDVLLHRHGDRWAVRFADDDVPVFESYTLEDAEHEAARLADGGEVRYVGDGDGAGAVADDLGAREAAGRPEAGERPKADRAIDAARPEDLRPGVETARPGEELRETQAGF